MKRKLLETLLAAENPDESARLHMVPRASEPGHAVGLLVLQAGLKRAAKVGRATPDELYGDLCTVPVATLGASLRATSRKVGELTAAELTQAQVFLNNALTSRAGRPRVSTKSREEQMAEAQQRRRERLASDGLKQLSVWVSHEAVAYLDAVRAENDCSSIETALQLVLDAQMKGKALKRPK